MGISINKLEEMPAILELNYKTERLKEDNKEIYEVLERNNFEHENFNKGIETNAADIESIKEENKKLLCLVKELTEVSELLSKEITLVNAQFTKITLWQIIKNSFNALKNKFKKKK